MKAKDLKNSILQLAIQGKLVPQDPKDEPASKLLEKIRAAKQKLVKEGKIKKDKQESFIYKGDDNNYYEKIGSEVRNITGEIPFEIPGSWAWVRLSDLITNIPSKLFQINTKEILDKGIYPVVSQSMNLIDGFSNEINKVLRLENPILLFGDHTRVLKLIDFDFIVGADGTKLLLPLLDNITAYLYYAIRYFIINMRTRGYSRHYQFIKNHILPLPPLEEQKRIVRRIEFLEPYVEEYDKAETELSVLNETFPEQIKKSILQYAIQGKLVPQDPSDEPASVLLDKIKAEKQKLIKAGKIKKDKVESYIYKRDNRHYEKIDDKEVDITDEIPFEIPDNWAWTRLGHIGFSRIGLTYKPQDICEEGTPVLRSGNIQNGEIILNNMVHVNCEVSHNLLVKNGDILICVRNGSKSLVGKNAIINSINVGEKMSFGAFMAIFRSKLNEYIKIYLDSALFKTMLKSTKTETINQITQSNLNQALIPIPPYTEQKRIVEKIEQLFKTLS